MSAANRPQPLTAIAQQRVAAVVADGHYAVDATVGNGHDTLFLAGQVGERGHVWGFDVQQPALAATAARLAERGLSGRVSLLHAGHQTLAERLPARAAGQLSAVMFNLGYLPGSDKQVTTRPDTTLQALAAALANLRPGGLLSVLAYRGHAGGDDESRAVADWLQEASGRGLPLEVVESPGPVLYLLRRLPA